MAHTLMIQAYRRSKTSRAALLAAMLAVLSGLSAAASAQPSTRVLVLPFLVTGERQQEDLLAFSKHVDEQLRSSLTLLGDRVEVESAKATQQLLGDKPAPESEDEARRIAMMSHADMVIYGFLGSTESAYHMKGIMWDLQRGRQAVATDMRVNNIHGLSEVLQVFRGVVSKRLYGSPVLPFYGEESPAQTGLARSARLSVPGGLPRRHGSWNAPQVCEVGSEVWALTGGDLDGDGKNETVMLSDTTLTIARFGEGGFRWLAQFSQAPLRFVDGEIEDIDGDGVAELICVAQSPVGMESLVIKYQGQQLRIVDRVADTVLRTVRESPTGESRILVGQRTDSDDLFNGEMIRFELTGGKLAKTGKLTLPAGTWLGSYAAGELGKTKDFLKVLLNQDQRLMVFDRDNKPLYIGRDMIFGMDRIVRTSGTRGIRDVVCPGRILIADTDGDGENEVLVMKQRDGASLIHALAWDGTALVEKWKTVASRGLISDFSVQDFRNDGIRSLVLVLIRSNPFPGLTGARSAVFAYELTP